MGPQQRCGDLPPLHLYLPIHDRSLIHIITLCEARCRDDACGQLTANGDRMSDPIQILIADDHTLFRDGLQALFGSLRDTAVNCQSASRPYAITSPIFSANCR